jgi:hypothetical protein
VVRGEAPVGAAGLQVEVQTVVYLDGVRSAGVEEDGGGVGGVGVEVEVEVGVLKEG